MVPRPRIVALDIEQDREEILRAVLDGQYSRYPVYRGEVENIIGFIHAKDLFGLAAKTSDLDLTSILRTPFFVPESKKVNDLLRGMQRGHIHMALVVDEYGSLSGIVTTEDLLEELVGEIEDEHDASESRRIQHLKDGAFLVDALLPLNDVEDLLGVRFPEGMPYDTLAGLILFQLGRFPAKGEQIVWGDYLLTCVKVTETAIQRVKIEKK